MSSKTPLPRQSVGKTFVIAISFLGLVAVLQVGAIGWVFLSRLQWVSPEGELQAVANGDMEGAGGVPQNGVEEERAREAEASPRPTPLRPARIQASRETLVLDLVDQAKELRRRGDMSNALNRLREAQTTQPNDPLVISELAVTYEEMNLHDRAVEHWRRLYDLGEEAGAFYQLAEVRLGYAWGDLDRSAVLFGPDSGGEGIRDAHGLQPGSTVGIPRIEVEEIDDPDLKKRILMNVHIKARPNIELDVRSVMIQVFFYEMVDDEHILITNSDVNFQWATDPPDWRQRNTEILEVEYRQAESGAGEDAEVGAYDSRDYYGYIAKIYYQDELQDVRAEPRRLLEIHPPPLTLQAD